MKNKKNDNKTFRKPKGKLVILNLWSIKFSKCHVGALLLYLTDMRKFIRYCLFLHGDTQGSWCTHLHLHEQQFSTWQPKYEKHFLSKSKRGGIINLFILKYTCQLFLSQKCMRFSSPHYQDFQKYFSDFQRIPMIFWRLPNIYEKCSRCSNDLWTLEKLFEASFLWTLNISYGLIIY